MGDVDFISLLKLQVSMLGKGFGDVGEAKGSSTTGSQFLEQFKTAQALAQLAAQHTQPAGSTTAASWDMGSTTPTSSLVQYGKEKQRGSPEGREYVLPELQRHAVSSGGRDSAEDLFTTNLAELKKIKELWVRLKCNSVCESLPVPFILGTVESVIPDSFRARDLVFLSLSECAELLPGVKLCQKKV